MADFVKKTQNSNESSKPFWRLRSGRGSDVHCPSNGEGLRDIQNSMSMVLEHDISGLVSTNHMCETCSIQIPFKY